MTATEEIGVAEWIPKHDFRHKYIEESPFEKLIRKCKDHPAVPIGLALTTGALTYGLIQFKKGKSMNQQFAMRARVGFQGFTILAIAYSMFDHVEIDKNKEQEVEKETKIEVVAETKKEAIKETKKETEKEKKS